MTREQFTDHWYDQLGAVLLHGYVMQDMDGILLHKNLHRDYERIRAVLGQIYDDISKTESAPAQAANGRQPTGVGLPVRRESK